MIKLQHFSLAMALWLPACAAFAAPEITAPTDVGNTTMPPGEYLVTEKSSSKAYSLMVTSKGTMILAPAPNHAAAAVQTPAAPTATVAPAAGAAATTAATTAAVAPGGSSMVSGAMKGLMQKGMQEGMNQLVKGGATKQLNKFIK
jgi:hypothetical protein